MVEICVAIARQPQYLSVSLPQGIGEMALYRDEAILWNEKPPIGELWASHGLHSIFTRELSATARCESTRPTHLPIADWANMAYCPDTMSTPAGLISFWAMRGQSSRSA